MPSENDGCQLGEHAFFSYETICKAGQCAVIGALVIACVLLWTNWLYGIALIIVTLGVTLGISSRYVFWFPRKPKGRPRVLMLHAVSDEVPEGVCDNNAIRPGALKALICDLKRAGYTFFTLEEAFNGEMTLPSRSVVLTFDDGTVDNYTDLFPVLKETNTKATIFATDRRTPAFLSDDQIKEMHASGLVEFGGHTISHVHLAEVPFEEACEQIKTNYQTLTKLLGKQPCSFAYPYGNYNQAVRDYCESIGYRYAVTMRKKYFTSDLFQIDRQIIPRDMTRLEAYLLATRGKAHL